MSFLRDLQVVDEAKKALQLKNDELRIQVRDLQAEVRMLKAKLVEQQDGTVLLDTKKDPDPYGQHGVDLAYRLRVMGWVE